jgi:tripartite-type tricarboxylate transporter receptor subunit TctC
MLAPLVVVAVLSAVLAFVPLSAGAAEWPTKPVRIVVAYAAGGANDLLARVFAEQLNQAFRQQFFVENRSPALAA